MRTLPFFDQETSTMTYLVFDEKTKDSVVIDPVWDFDPPTGKLTNRSFQLLVQAIIENGLKLHYILETHAHADHLSSSQLLKSKFPDSKIAISERIKIVQETFKNIFHIDYLKPDGNDFDYLIKDDEIIKAGSLTLRAIPTPGHTPACTSFLIENCLFTGDALFMPDYGTGRCDFPKGSAATLFESIKKLYSLPQDTVVYVGHDYQPNGRSLAFMTTIGDSMKNNIQLKMTTTKDEFIQFRQARDKTLKAPKLLLPSLQVNIAAGHLPPKEDNGESYLKLPLKIVD
jgi:glyoxylase-like metal-dependent hydrolase (beta-lactamase superfamily II)